MKVVLDTNVLVSALLRRDSIPGRLLQAVWDGAFDLVLSEPLLTELREVLTYPKIHKRLLATFVAAEADWLVSGDEDLLVLADQYPILSPAAFFARFLS